MAHAVAHALPAARRRALVFPREHGAWGMLFVPLSTGALVALASGSNVLPLFALVVAAFALFCLRTPVEALLGTAVVRAQGREERSLASTWATIYAAAAGLAISFLFQSGYARGLLMTGAFAAVTFAAQAGLRQAGRSWRAPAQIVGAAGLCSTAAAAYYVVAGRIDATALTLWAMNFAFAAGQVHYVQLRIHQAHAAGFAARLKCAPGFFFGQLALLLAAASAAYLHFLPLLAVVALVPALFRGFYWYVAPSAPLDVRRLGHHELAHAIAFGLLLIASYRHF